ncbi:DUF6233 domain-containing protein [Streptomyces dubilierae]|uniref:DUF6233 domain-containing protein n=1 Tax=Streptomyces dubilierae TaxID=3075533 RepID=A0ABU2P6S7_9ACTN|nr:DUF6233 domain-containing protein [Streptomyces sp. DSM 41921]MDT0387848.1 DUF6233 domain-containing protein [Streptomyces sp. DSM 41921]
MNDPESTRLTLLRFLEQVQERDLARTRRWIADEERRVAERQRGIERRPPAPDWLLELGLNRNAPAVQLHVGGCWNGGKRTRALSRDEALRALADGVKACTACRPDSELRFLDG